MPTPYFTTDIIKDIRVNNIALLIEGEPIRGVRQITPPPGTVKFITVDGKTVLRLEDNIFLIQQTSVGDYTLDFAKIFETFPANTYNVKLFDQQIQEIEIVIDAIDEEKTEIRFVKRESLADDLTNALIKGTTNTVYYSRNDLDAFIYLKLTEPLNAVEGDTITFRNNVFADAFFTVTKEEEVIKVDESELIIELDPSINPLDSLHTTTSTGSFESMTTYFSQSINYMHKLQDQGDDQVTSDFTDYANHIFFGSAEKTAKVAYEKIGNYYNTSQSFVTGSSSFHAGISQSMMDQYGTFTPYEKYLFWNKDGYPKTGNYSESLISPSSAVAQTWYTTSINSGSEYDAGNTAYLRWHVPNFYFETEVDNRMSTFVDMMGAYFDESKLHIDQFSRMFHNKLNDWDHAPDRLLKTVLDALGLDVEDLYSAEDFYKYILGRVDKDVVNFNDSKPLKEIMQSFYLRLLSTLPYIYKTKGTKESVKAILNCFGIPATMFTPKEHASAMTVTDFTPRGRQAEDRHFTSLQFGSGSGTYLEYN